MFKKFLWLVVAVVFLCSPLWAQDIPVKNHFKTWRVTSEEPIRTAQVQDQFMTDFLQLQQIEFLSNPTIKVHGAIFYDIVDPLHHLNWYRAFGRDTLISLEYVNQIESTRVEIDSVKYLLIPAQKLPHNPPAGLDHYKAYRIRNPLSLDIPVQLQDQFDVPNFEQINSITQAYFLTPASKNGEVMIDTFTHYVAYLLDPPGTTTIGGVQTIDQFTVPPQPPHALSILRSEMLLVPTKKILQPPPPPDTGKNHYKAWRVTPMTVGQVRQVKDQFMTDTLDLVQLEYLSNPVRKVVFNDTGNDTFDIADQDDHLTWYRAFGRDTLLSVEYVNQFESTTVEIDSVNYLLLPAQKDGHLPPDSLDHYKAYRIRNPQLFNFPVQLEDQFDRLMGTVENITSFLPVYFLTPCQKENEQTYDMATHYVAYVIPPMSYNGPPRQITDQFLFQRTVDVFNSQFVLVPTRKISVGQPTENCCFPAGPCGPVPLGTCAGLGGFVVPACLGDGNGNGIDDACEQPTIDTLRNHFKTWRVIGAPKDTFALVRDQFVIHDFLFTDSIDFLSNPVRKVVFGATQNDTSDITRADDHLTWYRVKSSNNRRINIQVTYVNQFESTKVFIDTVKYFLLPTQKLFPSHNPPDTLLGHYTAYRIHKPKTIKPSVELLDQFDVLLGTPERLDSLKPAYFLTPADKNNELRPNADTHYVAYQIFPKTLLPGLTTQTIDQWGLHPLQVRNSEYLLVPSRKDTFVVCTHKPNDCNGNGTVDLADIVCDVNVVFKPATNPKPVPNCRCDSNGNGTCDLTDIVHKVNYVFKGGPEPVVKDQCCIPVK